MTVGRAFRKLTRLIRRLESSDWTVTAVEPRPGSAFEPGDRLVATVCCRREHGTGDTSGTSPAALLTEPRGAPPEVVDELRELSTDVAVNPDSLRVEPDGATRLELTVEVTIDGGGRSPNGTANASQNGAGDTPLHRDRNRLWRLYQEHDTFGNMADAVDRAVSEETIRRYMIDHGIHDPDVETNGHRHTNGHGASPPEEAQSGLPAAVDPEQFVTAIVEGKTVREVSTRLDLDRETTVALLSELGLLEAVMAPLREASERSVSEAEVRARIEQATPASLG